MKKTRVVWLLAVVVSLFTILSCKSSSVRHNSHGSETQTASEETKSVSQSAVVSQPNKQEDKFSRIDKINIYIENSGSMNGYVNQASDFQDAVQMLIVRLKRYYDENSINMFYITDRPYPINIASLPNHSIVDAIPDILTKTQFSKHGHTGSTELNDILKKVLQDTNNNTLSVVISDYILSIQGHGTTRTLLNRCRRQTEDTFNDKLKSVDNLATVFIQLESQFVGGYNVYTNPNSNPVQLNCVRPYYMCIIGSNENLTDLNSKIKFHDLTGYRNHINLSSKDLSQTAYTLLPSTNKEGKFKPRSKKTPYHSIKDAEVSKSSHSLQFAVAVDLSKYPMTEEEKCCISNYEVTNNLYRVESIESCDRLSNPADCALAKSYNCTHFITLRSLSGINSCELRIKKVLPDWVEECTSENDVNIKTSISEQKKTFGLKYFLNGIYDAFTENNEDKEYIITLPIIVSKN